MLSNRLKEANNKIILESTVLQWGKSRDNQNYTISMINYVKSWESMKNIIMYEKVWEMLKKSKRDESLIRFIFGLPSEFSCPY